MRQKDKKREIMIQEFLELYSEFGEYVYRNKFFVDDDLNFLSFVNWLKLRNRKEVL